MRALLVLREARGDHGDTDDAAHVVVDLRTWLGLGLGIGIGSGVGVGVVGSGFGVGEGWGSG